MPRRTVATFVVLVFGAVSVIATDWPQVLGPTRTGVYAGPPLSETWGATGPKVVWRKPVGQAFAGQDLHEARVLCCHIAREERDAEARARRRSLRRLAIGPN